MPKKQSEQAFEVREEPAESVNPTFEETEIPEDRINRRSFD